MALNTNFVKPQYDMGGFATLPQTVKHLLTAAKAPSLSSSAFDGFWRSYDTLVFFLIDSFGWRFLERYQDFPFLRQIAAEGSITPLTAQFPSTTAAHVTCIHTGLPVGQSGVYEWQYYEPQLDALIAPLLFSFAGTKNQGTLKTTKIDPQKLYPTQTIYQELQPLGITSFIFQHESITTYSIYSNILLNGATVIPYKTLSEALVNLQNLLVQQKSKSYFFLYFGTIDSICHDYGPNSPQLEAEIDTLLTMLDRLFLQKLKGQLANTLFIMTADHGQIEVDPHTTIYLNLDPQFSGFHKYLKHNQKGRPLVPGGSARDMFLYIKDEMLDDAQEFLAKRLTGKAEVHKVQTLIEQEFFGPLPVSAMFLSRVGNLVILPHPNETVWWYERGKFEQKFYGHHGGLTHQEMDIPLILYNLKEV
jgi:predicted AlkP superfamily pyrophosphatase or phosphodiesterase